MNKSQINSYLHALEQELHKRGLLKAEILEEVESHLLEARDEGIQQGLDEQTAQQQALSRFGSAEVVARRFEFERRSMKQKLLLIAAALFGMLVLFIDSRPTWDDTGITVLMLLAGSGLIGLLVEKRPWLFALAIGVWLPAWYIFKSQDVKMLIVLAFPLVGVYVGWALKAGFRRLRKAG